MPIYFVALHPRMRIAGVASVILGDVVNEWSDSFRIEIPWYTRRDVSDAFEVCIRRFLRNMGRFRNMDALAVEVQMIREASPTILSQIRTDLDRCILIRKARDLVRFYWPPTPSEIDKEVDKQVGRVFVEVMDRSHCAMMCFNRKTIGGLPTDLADMIFEFAWGDDNTHPLILERQILNKIYARKIKKISIAMSAVALAWNIVSFRARSK
jgi:hypothetical protein